jgi:hypothetical protein
MEVEEGIGLLQGQCELKIPKTVPFWASTSGRCKNNVTTGRWIFASDIFHSCGHQYLSEVVLPQEGEKAI